ncbi:hypothetical protein Hdeb2414_s0118g00801871 [Helianthus debilis subsp. tardiflorus]
MEQRITTPAESRWLPNLLGFDNKLEYKSGSLNHGANALSHKHEFHFLGISHPWSTIWADIQHEALFKLQGSVLCMSSSYHPQSDREIEVINRILE